ncbi:Ropporin-1-like family protein [Opisthorchis viverrini]|uniref:Rhophilin associated tail protein 1-like protein n=1 Tax=Opisthorchis viverrini TaxID=6198 RepID=A0A076YGW5_OPIVI|nr:rhophilin associated tail protein 1-like protein [Opisthorchis viverrini]OON14724.1 Ropporin-1-like family protein [Opisthorchis viverrini]
MPLVNDPYYCHEQIPIPPALPDILKQFTKAAIRTQPKDVLKWSYAYFRALANSEPPPVKDRLEVPISTQKTDTGLTPGLLRVLNNQLAVLKTIPVTLIEEKWKDLSLPIDRFQELCRIGNFVGTCEWRHFLAIAASDLCATLEETLKLICELLTSDPEGGPARISFETWLDFYRYLGKLDEISDAHINHVMTYLTFDIASQEGMIMPRNFMHPECPKLKPLD